MGDGGRGMQGSRACCFAFGPGHAAVLSVQGKLVSFRLLKGARSAAVTECDKQLSEVPGVLHTSLFMNHEQGRLRVPAGFPNAAEYSVPEQW